LSDPKLLVHASLRRRREDLGADALAGKLEVAVAAGISGPTSEFRVVTPLVVELEEPS
jgi:hypothetical protein